VVTRHAALPLNCTMPSASMWPSRRSTRDRLWSSVLNWDSCKMLKAEWGKQRRQGEVRVPDGTGRGGKEERREEKETRKEKNRKKKGMRLVLRTYRERWALPGVPSVAPTWDSLVWSLSCWISVWISLLRFSSPRLCASSEAWQAPQPPRKKKKESTTGVQEDLQYPAWLVHTPGLHWHMQQTAFAHRQAPLPQEAASGASSELTWKSWLLCSFSSSASTCLMMSVSPGSSDPHVLAAPWHRKSGTQKHDLFCAHRALQLCSQGPH